MDGKELQRAAAALITAAVTAASPFLASIYSPNVYLTRIAFEDTPQYRFAQIIRQADDQTLLNDGFLDGGFYYAAGVQPSGPYFCTLNIDLKDMDAALQRSVRLGETAFVVTRQKKLQNNRLYRLVDECSMPYEGRTWHYYLYRRIDEPT